MPTKTKKSVCGNTSTHQPHGKCPGYGLIALQKELNDLFGW